MVDNSTEKSEFEHDEPQVHHNLEQYQALSMQSKIALSKSRIRQWHIKYEGNVYIAYSGGKDSTVLMHLVKEMYPDVPAVYCNTGLEYPEVKRIALKHADAVLTPKMKFKDVIEKYGYAVVSKEQSQYIREARISHSESLRMRRIEGDSKGRFRISKKWQYLIDAPFKISEKCCHVFKKEPSIRYENETGRKAFVGNRAGESQLRRQAWLKHGCNMYDLKRPISMPLAFWTDSDILEYIVINELEYASVYGEIKRREDGTYYCTGEQRTGCMFCMFGVHLEPEPNKFQRMQKTHPMQYDLCINGLGLGGVLEYLKVPFVYTEKPPEPRQMDLFDGIKEMRDE